MTRARRSFRSLLSTPAPPAAVEIAARRVTAVVLTGDRQRPALAGCATEPLPPGAVAPAMAGVNVADRAAVIGAIRRAFSRLGRRPARVALVVPDSAAKVSIVRFEKIPSRAADLEQLLRWQVRKAAPFRLEDAQVAHTPGAPLPGGGREFVVALMRREIVEEYESACADAGAHAGIVDLASFNLINAVLAASAPDGDDADWLLVHVAQGYSTLAIVRGEHLIFFRNRPAEEGQLTDLVHQTAMYYEDRLGGQGFARVVLADDTADEVESASAALRVDLEARLGVATELIDPRAAAPLTDRIAAGAGLLGQIAAPVGLLLREQAAP